MTQYALAFAPVGTTYLVRMDDSELLTIEATEKRKKGKTPVEELPDELAEPTDFPSDPRITFVDEQLKSGDVIWTELGGAGGPFIRRAFRRGVQVNRVPNLYLPAVELETSEDETGLDKARRERAFAIAQLAANEPERFYPVREMDALVALISIHTRRFDFWQKRLRIKAQQQLIQINRELAYVEDDELGAAELRIKRQFASPDLLAETVRIESILERLLKRLLERLPLYSTVFEPIRGCGILTSARIIDVVQDIRRFSNQGRFLRYSGWGLGTDGQVIKRRRGETLGYSTRMKQALNLFGDQVGVYHRGPDELVSLFDETKEAALSKGLSKMHAQRRAKRKVIQEFARLIFRNWWLFEVTGGGMDGLVTPQEEIPSGVRQVLAYHYPNLGVDPDNHPGWA